MNLGIMTSSLDTLNLESKITFATALLTTLRDKDYNIVMGSGTKGLMGTVKEIAKENGSILTVVGYDDLELNKNDASVKIKVESPVERTKILLEESDVLLFGPGGLGTLSELFSILTTKVEIEDDKPIIIYNEDHSYDDVIRLLDKKEKDGSISKAYKTTFTIINNKEDLATILDSYEIKEERNKVR